ncbi:MAG: energy-coupling factor ABC transporter ATP-binding protein [Beijerinckiaceae bacterium]|nr:energy-coupling factor ABC transporter ATP-binding protein [Beijerinckiaceae bacterium]
MKDAQGPLIELEGVKLRRGSRLVFDGLSVSLAERRVGLLGDNGAGKSSFLRLLNGLLLPDEGHVRVDGLETSTSRRELPRKVGFVFQNPEHQIVFPTVLEEVAFGFRDRGSRRDIANAKARDVLARFNCGDWADAAVHELSDGQKQRLCIIAIVAMEPDILLMDEPFSSLDLPTRLDLTDFLLHLPQRVVIASHELELLGVMDRVIWMSAGAIVAEGPPDEVIGAYRRHAMQSRKLAAAPT